jgi:hypothetical protein
MTRWRTIVLLVFVTTILAPPRGEACSCSSDSSLAAHVQASDIVFVGEVTRVEREPAKSHARSDDSVKVGGPARAIATLDVQKVYHGDVDAAVQLPSGPNGCDLTFTAGDVWLVYASRRDERMETTKCSRSRLVTKARVDLEYLDGLQTGRSMGVVQGLVVRRGYDGAGRPALVSPSRTTRLAVVALSRSRRIEIEPAWSAYQLVLSPGPATVWVEKDGVPVMAAVQVAVAEKGEHRAMLITEFDDREAPAVALPR